MNSVEKQVNLLAEMAGNKGSPDKEERTKNKEAEKKFEEGDDEEMEELDLSKLINPCEKMMETR
jgi:F0F1-type ATP synthase epsilon subunit